MFEINDINVVDVSTIIAPQYLKQVFPTSYENAKFVYESRNTIRDIIHQKDKRLLAVVGPCSIHDPKGALEYAARLKKLADELADKIFIVMRVYFEKPRTTVGWKGLINDPDMNRTHLISKGLGIARQLFCSITDLKLPIACEMLDPITPQYLADNISWGAIGARTTESQTHREMASGLSFTVGFKNGTDGNLRIAMDAMEASSRSHSFLGVGDDGMTAIVQTKGNPDVHIVLRGGNDGPNYSKKDIEKTIHQLSQANLCTSIMVDCSHANSCKDHNRQPAVLDDVVTQIINDKQKAIKGVMIESNLFEGSQSIPEDLSQLKYGVSVTDKCVGWETTEKMLRKAYERL